MQCMDETAGAKRWAENRTTFQRVYDILVGTQSHLDAREFADRANCSASGARQALDQLSEMGIAQKRAGRPATYRRNESYFRWKRIESLARDYSSAELHDRLEELTDADEAFQNTYGVPEPDAVSTTDLPVDDHDAVHERWEDLSEWRTVRRDIKVLRQAVDRVESQIDDGVRA